MNEYSHSGRFSNAQNHLDFPLFVGHADNSENIQSKLSIDWLSGAKLDSQVGHWLHLDLGAQVALAVLVVLALQAHPAERP